MSNSKHTPGPWAWQKFGKEWCLTGQHGMRPIVLAVRKRGLTSLVNGLLVQFDPSLSDSALIAAAPELLEALQNMLSHFGHQRREEWLNEAGWQSALACENQAKAAIDKATGGEK